MAKMDHGKTNQAHAVRAPMPKATAGSQPARWPRQWVVVALWSFAALYLLGFFAGFKLPPPPPVVRLWQWAANAGRIHNDIEREAATCKTAALGRALDHRLPPDARIFEARALGEENYGHLGNHFLLAYHIYPRPLDISLGVPARLTNGPAPEGKIYFAGREAANIDEVYAHGYDAIFDFAAQNQMNSVYSKRLSDLNIAPDLPANLTKEKQIYPYFGDMVIACLLPAWVAWLGASLLRRLLPQLYAGMRWGERAACGLGLGALVLGQALCALRLLGLGLPWVPWVIMPVWSLALLLQSGRPWREIQWPQWPPVRFNYYWLGLLPWVAMFAPLFWLAGQLGIEDFDATVGWLFKAKLMYYHSGTDLISAFSNPNWGYAHLDYPTLVPSLHLLTYATVGHFNDFLTKFWPVWMLLLLSCGVLSLCGWPAKNPLAGLALGLAVVFLPLCKLYVLHEGATLPLVFFLVLASAQLALGIAEDNRERRALGLLLLVGAAMCKLEGMILLGLWVVMLLATRRSWTSLRPDRFWLAVGGVALACVAPWLALRCQIPVLHPEARWLQTLCAHPGEALSHWPRLILALFSRQFAGDGLFAWASPDHVHLLRLPKGDGWMALFGGLTYNLAWAGVLAAWALYRLGGNPRRAVFAGVAATLLAGATLALVFSSLPSNIYNLESALGYVEDATGGRYFSPIVCAWVLSLAIVVLRAYPAEPTAPRTRLAKD